MKLVSGQSGGLFFINGKFAGMELFDSSETFSKMFGKIIKSYAIDALETVEEAQLDDSPGDPDSIIKGMADMEAQRSKSRGKGDDLRLSSERMTGAGLLADNDLIHISVLHNV